MTEQLFSIDHRSPEAAVSNSPEDAQKMATKNFSDEVNTARGDSASPKPYDQSPTDNTTCIMDGQGFIDCGPIVGYSRPETPKALPDVPIVPDAPASPNAPADPWHRIGGMPPEGGGVPEKPIDSPPKIEWPKDPKFE